MLLARGRFRHRSRLFVGARWARHACSTTPESSQKSALIRAFGADDFGATFEYLGREYHNSFRVPIELRQTPGRGVGLFAGRSIPKGTLVCFEKDVREVALSIPEARASLEACASPELRQCFLAHSWGYIDDDTGEAMCNLTLDVMAFNNHSARNPLLVPEAANPGSTGIPAGPGDPDTQWVAALDIVAGDELTTDYLLGFGEEPQGYLDLHLEFSGQPQWVPTADV